ncbi:MAG: phosphate ABC transporter permease PstA [Pseudomonadota bacterium]|nr:phosphate ABC transporter permease PstA [Pseudomonadota bacterium]
MTDPSSTIGQPAAKRLRQRYNAERRFKRYGQIAIAVAVGFLAILLLSIGTRAASAFSHHTVTVTIDQSDFSDRDAVSVTKVNLAVREALQDLFPETRVDATSRTDLFGLTTRLAVLPLTRRLQAQADLGAGPVTAKLALSDELDLYLKYQVQSQQKTDIGRAGRLSRTDENTLRLTNADLNGFDAFQAPLETSEMAPSKVLVSVSDAWFELQTVSGAALILRHLAGPMPRLGEQDRTAISAIVLPAASDERRVSNRQIAMVLFLQQAGHIQRQFNTGLFTNSDSTYPELAGAAAAIVGSLFTMLVTAIFALPIGVLAAVYLEEFAKKSILTNVIEVNINNLAAVPSIIFGLLGAAVFLNTLGLPRSVPLVGGLVLGLLILPTIIIASRAALRSVPPSVRDAALGLGASPTQTVFHHVLPLAAPGILTGAIIAMARALGETAPLLLIGMVAFVSEIPSSPDDEATVLPVLIFKWFSGAERAWEPMTSAVIVVLLTVLVSMNLVAVLLRRHFERRW